MLRPYVCRYKLAALCRYIAGQAPSQRGEVCLSHAARCRRHGAAYARRDPLYPMCPLLAHQSPAGCPEPLAITPFGQAGRPRHQPLLGVLLHARRSASPPTKTTPLRKGTQRGRRVKFPTSNSSTTFNNSRGQTPRAPCSCGQ